MFLPSGRVHAIGAGLVLFEVQQNSDSTYRVFDWNRLGLDGKPRALHVPQSLASINFKDFEPALLPRDIGLPEGSLRFRLLADHPLFKIHAIAVESRGSLLLSPDKLKVIAVERGPLVIASGEASVELASGQFCLVPAAVKAEVRVQPESSFLLVRSGDNSS
jgi:mannose-6-phosphate isomerase